MRPIPSRNLPRPGLRAALLGVSSVLIGLAAVLVATIASEHLATTATNEAVRTTAAVVHGYVDPLVAAGHFADPTPDQASAIDDQLGRLVASHQILRIKIWSPAGTVLYSDLAALRGRSFPIDDALSEALSGSVATDYSSAAEPENVFEAGLASEFLSIYLPVTINGQVAGAYEIYEDAAPIQAQIDATRTDMLLVVGGLAAAILLLLWVGFSGAARLLAGQTRRLLRSERRFRSLVQNSADVHMVVRPDGAVVYESEAVERVLGWPPEQHVGSSVFAIVHPDDRGWLEQMLAEVATVTDRQLMGEVRASHRDGSWRTLEIVVKNLLDDAAVDGIVVNYRDVSVRKALEAELTRQAFHDSLTGLANRALFIDRLEHALARTRGFRTALAVLFVDLDDFKTVNDSLGHNEGDQLLIAVAERFGEVVRAGDTVARMGGDEFAILVEDATGEADPAALASRLMAALEPPFEHAGKELFVHASVGIAQWGLTTRNGEELLRDADVAMYTAKAAGKNRMTVFQPSMHAAALARLALKADLERALDRDEFRLVYQPIVDLARDQVVGVEALLRWEHPSRGTVAPGDFIDVAEETGLIVGIGRWVLEQATRQLCAWDAELAFPLAMSINVSGRQLQDNAFTADLARVLAATGLAPGRLTIELTESVLMQDADAAVEILRDLKALGVRLAIDDFGTGYSSLAYLRRFPIDELKVDRSFVAAMGDGPEQTAVVLSILRLGETLHLHTVAEGIESLGQLSDLRELGAEYGQGYFFARPMEPDAIVEVLHRARANDAGTARRGHVA